jgi:hypothetical protein
MALLGTKDLSHSNGDLEALVNDLGVIWGAETIGKAIGRTKRQTFYLLENGQIPEARKVGRCWVVSRSALQRQFGVSA